MVITVKNFRSWADVAFCQGASMKCPKCDKVIFIDDDEMFSVCEYCDSQYHAGQFIMAEISAYVRIFEESHRDFLARQLKIEIQKQKEAAKMALKQIGALWRKEGQKGDYLTGELDLGVLGKVNIAVFTQEKKEENHPDAIIMLFEDSKKG